MTCALCIPPIGVYHFEEKAPLLFTVDTTLTPTEQSIRVPSGRFRAIDWGDGSPLDTVNAHTYAGPGEYQVKVWPVSDTHLTVEARSLVSLDAWGDIPIGGISFAGTTGVFSTPHFTSVPDFLPQSVTSVYRMFAFSPIFNDANVSLWDTSNVTNFELCFYGALAFNQPLTMWDTRHAVTFQGMFREAREFNQPLDHFITENVVDMRQMFYGASAFNSSLAGFDTSVTTTMSYMFNNATSFNQPVGHFNTGEVRSFDQMFNGATAFAQSVSSFDTAKADNMTRMFRGATAFNDDLSAWCVALIPSEPVEFAAGAGSWTLPKPVWGTCP